MNFCLFPQINNDLIHYGLQPVSIRLIRKRKTGKRNEPDFSLFLLLHFPLKNISSKNDKSTGKYRLDLAFRVSSEEVLQLNAKSRSS